MKKFLLTFLILTLFIPTVFAHQYQPVTVNTTFKSSLINDGAINIDETLYLPLAEISEALGAVVFENNDKIAVFDKGEIVQVGTHEQLLADVDGKYYELWNAQAQYYTKSA